VTVKAKDTIPGGIYRRTRQGMIAGVYYTRSKRKVENFVKKMKRRANPTTRDYALIMEHKRRGGEVILMVCHHRVKDSITGAKKELNRFVFIDPEYTFRQVQTPPGYGGNHD
jgi:hypothetical protein